MEWINTKIKLGTENYVITGIVDKNSPSVYVNNSEFIIYNS